MSFHLLAPVVKPLLYLDPGSGSLIIQMVIAALLGIGVTTRLFWGKIKSIFRKGTPGEETSPVDTKDEE